ncbi:bifunctional aspartate kinase/homoserine dehydrogenase II [Kangiella sp.]|uniref:bifunctional aspartate kinase/homoserine dehydrogenase II n=1 Tax=Kangiella sp. TaxID=1920245 RepID=UPI00199E6B4D|nr:bifunctional aspartate kinase/homoserine dehydrogenase II [Kangiella sp.]MBD3653637.1 bifunctional aspartate kinase/homoserine dehydrogenase II [Kangiella sp.]
MADQLHSNVTAYREQSSHAKTYKSLGVAVHKFGGSSLASIEQLKKVSNIIMNQTSPGNIIVVSANGDITDQLLNCINGRHNTATDIIEYFKQLVVGTAINAAEFLQQIEQDLLVIQELCQQTPTANDTILAYGEKWSAKLLSELLNSEQCAAQAIDASHYLKLTSLHEYQQFDEQYADASFSSLYQPLLSDPKYNSHRFIFTGFIASDTNGKLITLGRNGSDYSATIIAQLVKATSVTIWTDVDGIYSADPNIVKNAKKVEHLSLCEAQAISELGANVLHQKTVTPLLTYKTQACIKSSLLDGSQGTQITQYPTSSGQVKTITIKQDLTRIVIHNINELSARTIQQRILLNQIASYASNFDRTLDRLTLYVADADRFNCVSIIQAAQFYPIVEKNNLSLISLVGQGIRQNQKIISKFIEHLERYPIEEIHYPSNAHTLSVLIEDIQAITLLHALHDTFFELEPSIPIVVLGYGNIGKQFVKILKDNKADIESSLKQSLSLLAVANSRQYILSKQCLIDRDDLFQLLHEQDSVVGSQCSNTLSDLHQNNDDQIINALEPYAHKELVIIDLTASDKIARLYPKFATNGWHIISANKIAASDKQLASKIEKIQSSKKRHWLRNTTAGAGIPIQSSIKKLKEAGDTILSISGIFSGSLSWLFGQYNGQQNFSDLLFEAKANAFTEPDPREDLSGNDVIRKIRILAREAGFTQARENFEPALDDELLKGSLEQFWQSADTINEHYCRLYNKAQEQGGLLRYIATLTKQELSLKLEIIDPSHPFANLNPCDNVFAIRSEWYKDNPLILQGPGAGREVTAAGVLNDLCDLLRSVS